MENIDVKVDRYMEKENEIMSRREFLCTVSDVLVWDGVFTWRLLCCLILHMDTCFFYMCLVSEKHLRASCGDTWNLVSSPFVGLGQEWVNIITWCCDNWDLLIFAWSLGFISTNHLSLFEYVCMCLCSATGRWLAMEDREGPMYEGDLRTLEKWKRSFMSSA